LKFHFPTFQKWATLKPTMPLGQLPVLTVGTLRIAQTTAIGAYVGAQLQLAGNGDYDAARCIMISAGIEDQNQAMGALFNKLVCILLGNLKFTIILQDNREITQAAFNQEMAAYAVNEMWQWAQRHEGFLTANGGVYLVGSTVSSCSQQQKCDSTGELGGHLRGRVHGPSGDAAGVPKLSSSSRHAAPHPGLARHRRFPRHPSRVPQLTLTNSCFERVDYFHGF